MVFRTLKKRGKVSKILKEKSGQDAIIEIDNFLLPLFRKNPGRLTREEKTIIFIEEYEREVNNGGFHQFYYNSAGDYFYEIVESLKRIKSSKFLFFLLKSQTPFPNSEIPKDRVKRQKILEEIEYEAEELWRNIELEFYKYEEDINKLIVEYILANIEHFR